MKLFKTKSRHTSYRTQPRRVGHVYTLKAKTRLKRWAKRRTKQLWRKAKARTKRLWRRAKQRIRRRWNRRPPAVRKRQIARNAQQFRQHHANMHAAASAGQATPPPLDGAHATCRRCSNEVRYNGGRGRWEHTGRGHAECFQPGRNRGE